MQRVYDAFDASIARCPNRLWVVAVLAWPGSQPARTCQHCLHTQPAGGSVCSKKRGTNSFPYCCCSFPLLQLIQLVGNQHSHQPPLLFL